jgi:hypothetical protein
VLHYNAILSEMCNTYDFAEARGQYLFTFAPGTPPPVGTPDQGRSSRWNEMVWNLDSWGGNPAAFSSQWNQMYWNEGEWGGSLVPFSSQWNQMYWNEGEWGPVPAALPLPLPPPVPGRPQLPFWPGNQFGSGPYLLPVDYLRLSGSSGSTGAQRSFIWWLQGVPYPVIPMDLAEFDLQVQQAGLQSFVWLSATDMSTPIDDRILLTTTGDVVQGSTRIQNLASTTRLIGGNVLGVAGQGIVPGTMLRGVDNTTPASAIISQPANATISGASLIFGYCPVVFIYPPPQTSLQAMIRYQKRMPDVFDLTRYPWFHHDAYVLQKLTGWLCQLNDDDRAAQLLGGPDVVGSPDQKLRLWLAAKDDEPSHPKTVGLDRRVFGRGWAGSTKVTKQVGW